MTNSLLTPGMVLREVCFLFYKELSKATPIFRNLPPRQYKEIYCSLVDIGTEELKLSLDNFSYLFLEGVTRRLIYQTRWVGTYPIFMDPGVGTEEQKCSYQGVTLCLRQEENNWLFRSLIG